MSDDLGQKHVVATANDQAAVASNKAPLDPGVITTGTLEDKVASLTAAHDASASRLDRLEQLAEDFADRTYKAAQAGELGDTAQEGASLTQGIVNFLHHVFPAGSQSMPVPGSPSVIDGSPKPMSN